MFAFNEESNALPSRQFTRSHLRRHLDQMATFHEVGYELLLHPPNSPDFKPSSKSEKYDSEEKMALTVRSLLKRTFVGAIVYSIGNTKHKKTLD